MLARADPPWSERTTRGRPTGLQLTPVAQPAAREAAEGTAPPVVTADRAATHPLLAWAP